MAVTAPPPLPLPLTLTHDVRRFVEQPQGHAFVGETFAYAHPSPALFVVGLFGRPTAANAHPLLTALRVELEPRIAPHASLVDARRVESVDADVFAALTHYVQETRDALARQVTRLCVLRPEGLSGAVVAGFFAVVDPPYPILVATSLDEAAAFLAPAPLEARALLEELLAVDAVVSSIADQPAVVAQLEAALRAGALDADLVAVARSLGTSRRTLQRRLAEVGTSFVDVQRAVRLREAARRLADTDAPITTIALECGWSSAQHFAADWRTAHDVTPSEWRARQRKR